MILMKPFNKFKKELICECAKYHVNPVEFKLRLLQILSYVAYLMFHRLGKHRCKSGAEEREKMISHNFKSYGISW